MKILKVILGIVLSLVVAVGVLSFIVPVDMRVERSIVINAPKEKVFDYLRHTKNQQEWSPWYKADPNMRMVTQGVDGVPGFVAAWEGNGEVGAGEQEIKSVKLDERIDSELRFKKPMEGKADAWFVTEDTGVNQTKVTWGFYSVSNRPFNALCWIMNTVTGMMEKTFDQGLTDLKTVLEGAATTPAAEAVPALQE